MTRSVLLSRSLLLAQLEEERSEDEERGEFLLAATKNIAVRPTGYSLLLAVPPAFTAPASEQRAKAASCFDLLVDNLYPPSQYCCDMPVSEHESLLAGLGSLDGGR